jgi:hypothetical protein
MGRVMIEAANAAMARAGLIVRMSSPEMIMIKKYRVYG